MNRKIGQTKASIAAFLLVALSLSSFVWADTKALRGKIITASKELNIPSRANNFVKKMLNQDRDLFRKDGAGHWNIHFVAFFNRKLPTKNIGIVVLDAKGEPVAVADVAGSKEQTTLASRITVETTETPGKPHTLQVYFAKHGKPIVLAKKQVILK